MSRDNTHYPKEEKATSSILKVGPMPFLDDTYISSFAESEWENETVLIWDEKGRSQLTQMFISYDYDCIKSLAFQYVEDGKCTRSPIFGCQNFYAPNFETLTFGDASDREYITRVSGSYQVRRIKTRLTSLTIETNESTYGPFGSNGYDGQTFQIGLGHGDQFGGFHGCSTPDCVTAIGVYLKPIQNLGKLYKKKDLAIE